MSENRIPEELKKFYNSLEKIKFISSWNLFKELEVSEDIEGVWEEKLIAERKLLNFTINNGSLIPSFTTTDIKGNQVSIGFSNKEIEYFKSRIKITSNKWLISKYAHIVWQETKHNGFAEIALSNYLFIINNIQKEEMHQQPVMLSAIIHIGKKTKKKKKEIKELIIDLLENKSLGLKYRNLQLAIENDVFDEMELCKIAGSLPSWVSDNPTSYFVNKDLLLLGLNIFHRLGRDKSNLYKLLAENENIILDQHQEDSDFIKYETTGTKAKYLGLAGRKKESEKYYQEYNRLKQTVKLGHIRTELEEQEIQMFNDYLNRLSEAILESDASEILSYFSLHPDVLVDPEEIRNFTEKNIKDSLSSLFTTTVFDINSNFKKLDESDKFSNEWIKNYAISHMVRCEALFLKVFVKGFIRGKINYFKIHEYLEKETWFGVKFKRGMTNNEIDRQSNWLTLLAPGVHNFFAQFEMSVLLNNNKIHNFILPIDSLTLKFEGALRDFILLSGGNTTKIKNGELKEQLLEDLLNNPIIIDYFGERDLELFKYTFTNKGRNIRNNIAHSFYQYSDYTLQTATLVFLCILRLGKYTFNNTKSNE